MQGELVIVIFPVLQAKDKFAENRTVEMILDFEFSEAMKEGGGISFTDGW